MRDPKQDPQRSDMLKSPSGVVLTVLGRPTFAEAHYDTCVRYSQSEIPYLTTINIQRWRHMVADYKVEHVAASE